MEECEGCEIVMRDMNDLDRHMHLLHKQEWPVFLLLACSGLEVEKCEACQFRTRDSKDMEHHERLLHKPSLRCKTCRDRVMDERYFEWQKEMSHINDFQNELSAKDDGGFVVVRRVGTSKLVSGGWPLGEMEGLDNDAMGHIRQSKKENRDNDDDPNDIDGKDGNNESNCEDAIDKDDNKESPGDKDDVFKRRLNTTVAEDLNNEVPEDRDEEIMTEPSITVEGDCPHCGKIFWPKRNLINHIQLHGIRGLCVHCGIPAKTEGIKEWHKGSVHDDDIEIDENLKEPEYYRGRRMSLVWESFLESIGPEAARRIPFPSPKAGICEKSLAPGAGLRQHFKCHTASNRKTNWYGRVVVEFTPELSMGEKDDNVHDVKEVHDVTTMEDEDFGITEEVVRVLTRIKENKEFNHEIKRFFCDHCGIPATRKGVNEWHMGNVHVQVLTMFKSLKLGTKSLLSLMTPEVALVLSVPTPSPIGALRPDLAPSRSMRVSRFPISSQMIPSPDLAQCRSMGIHLSHGTLLQPSLPYTPLSRPCSAGLRGACSKSKPSKVKARGIERAKINNEALG